MVARTHIKSPFDGIPIGILAISPSDSPRAVLLVAHGVCGRKERFTEFMTYLSERGIACVAHDHRGHGESILDEKDRGYTYGGRSEALITDMEAVNAWARLQFPGIPVFLLGHSMGSMAARTYIRKHDGGISGLIVCGTPSYNPGAPIGHLMSRIANIFNNGRRRSVFLQEMISRNYNRKFRKEGDKAWTCSVEAVRESVRQDPQCNFTMTADYSLTIMELMRSTYSSNGWKVSNKDMPILFLSGEDDPCMRGKKGFQKSVESMRKAGYKNIRYVTYPGMRHEVLHEKGKEKVWNEILEVIS